MRKNKLKSQLHILLKMACISLALVRGQEIRFPKESDVFVFEKFVDIEKNLQKDKKIISQEERKKERGLCARTKESPD